MSIDNNTTIEQKETEEKFKTALSDFFGITEGGEIKAGGITATAKHVVNAIFEFVQASAKDIDITGFEISSAGIGITFDLAKGYIETTIDGRDRSGSTKEYYARPNIHFFKLLAKGLVTGTADLVISKKIDIVNDKMPTIVKTKINFVKNLAISQLTSKTFDSFFGSQIVTIDFTKDKNSSEVLERKYLVQDSLESSLEHYWGKINGDMRTLERVIVNTEDLGNTNIIYYRVTNKTSELHLANTLYLEEYSGKKSEDNLISFLKRFESSFLPKIKKGSSDEKLMIVNYYANYGAGAGRVESDLNIPKSNNPETEAIRLAAAHCLDELKGYALEKEINPGRYDNLTNYSDNHMSDRYAFFSTFIQNYVGNHNSSKSILYTDTKLHKSTGSFVDYQDDIANLTSVIFVDGSFNRNTGENKRIYGYSNSEIINVAGSGNVYAELGEGSDTITTGSGDDVIYTNASINDKFDYEDSNTKNIVNSGEGDDTIYGSKAKDIVNGGDDKDTIYGKGGDDTLSGLGGSDVLVGGIGADHYVAHNGDVIIDEDGMGYVELDWNRLTGGKYDKSKKAYVGNNGEIYKLSGSTLKVYKGSSSITIENYSKSKNSLGITLLDQGEISITISDNEKAEGNNGEQSMNFDIKVNGEIPKGEYAIININGQEYLIGNPSTENIKKDNLNISKYKRTLTYTHKWQGNEEKEEDKKFTISGSVVKSSQGLKVKEIISGNGKIIDDDKDDKQDPEDVDPIIIDLNKNKITSTKLNNTIYFDHDNNNFKEASSWIDKGDAFLALDKNSNGLIDNGNELFGNHTISNTRFKYTNNKATNGYEALKAYDLNGDNVIDSKDEIYDKLLLWKDSNQNSKNVA